MQKKGFTPVDNIFEFCVGFEERYFSVHFGVPKVVCCNKICTMHGKYKKGRSIYCRNHRQSPCRHSSESCLPLTRLETNLVSKSNTLWNVT